MRVLVCGGNGFLGRHICAALVHSNHDPVVRSRRSSPALDFLLSTQPGDWLEHLAGIDAVINAVGALRDKPDQPLDVLHTQAPIALFDACVQAGVQRVVQISALGIGDSNTHYARSKRTADEHLLALHAQGALNATVIRPSIIFGTGGASTRLFLQLARLPLLMLPAEAMNCPIQPVAAQDLAEAIATITTAPTHKGLIELGGPRALTLGELLVSLRAQRGAMPARIHSLPQWLANTSARIGDHLPSLPWCSESMAMLQTPNVCDPDTLRSLLGREPVAPDALYASLPATAREKR
ncbi:NAD-dependent epimerase/dehydratase family protein [Comamonas sp. NoAH]|uniref:NAD-dependent epimerase/dehydratase family protein n=1 Tax=Comamonas halotolerans TaxID=3041496 RepID=UPI0024E0AABE|nr:NAD-dependent epimerase/dehydratase family protein [Comamonas sp. NoAH]